MNEQEWLGCTDPWSMLSFLQFNASVRKLRLFAAASCSSLCGLIPENRLRRGIELIEEMADGFITHREVVAQEWGLGEVLSLSGIAWRGLVTFISAASEPKDLKSHPPWFFAGRAAACAVEAVCLSEQEKLPWFRSFFRGQRVRFYRQLSSTENKKQTYFVKDIFGNPFRSITIKPAWLAWSDGTVRRIAQSIYEERAFDRMPILADALMDAGCDNEDILNHCRSESPHVKGCWVVDSLLGKE